MKNTNRSKTGRFFVGDGVWDISLSYPTHEAIYILLIYFSYYILTYFTMSHNTLIAGTYTALVTPFSQDGNNVDYATLRELIEHQVSWWVQWVVPVGTTGESPTLTANEHIRVIQETVEQVQWRIIVIAGAWSNNTREAVQYAQEAEHVWANMLLSVVPYYNKPNQEWLYRHFRTQAEATRLPIVLYSIPWRCGTGVELSLSTITRLATDVPNIVGIKEAWWNLDRFSEIRMALDASWNTGFSILSGDDSLTVPTILTWASAGVISVASNILPREISNMVHEALYRDRWIAERSNEYYRELFDWLFMPGEPNPQVAKYILSRMRQYQWRLNDTLRLPLIGVTEEHQSVIDTLMQKYAIS